MTAVPDHLDRRFRKAASEAGLLDVAYDLADSPVGPLLVAASARGLCRISFDPEPERELDALARAFGTRVLRSPSGVDLVRRELDEYFEGRRREFDLEVDLSPLPAFQRDVLEELVRVPCGNVDTYGGLARRIGRPRAARSTATRSRSSCRATALSGRPETSSATQAGSSASARSWVSRARSCPASAAVAGQAASPARACIRRRSSRRTCSPVSLLPLRG